MTGSSFSQLLASHKFAAHTESLFLQTKACAYGILAETGEGGVGQSRLGGAPDLHHESSWPEDRSGRKMRFVLQVNLSDVPDAARLGVPSEGLLSLFVGAMEPGNDIQHAVRFCPDVGYLDRFVPPDDLIDIDDSLQIITAYRLRFEPALDPRPGALDQLVHDSSVSEGPSSRELAIKLRDAYDEFTMEGAAPAGVVVKIGGYPVAFKDELEGMAVNDTLLGAPFPEHEPDGEMAAKARAGWQHLMTVFSNTAAEVVIWDAGCLGVAIHEVSMSAGFYGKTYAAVSSS